MTGTERQLLRVEGVHAGYGSVRVLHDISFSVFEGEIVAVIGSNGAGKSALMRTISGLLPPVCGEIVFAGRPIGGLDCSEIVRLGIAQAPEGRRMFSGLTVLENLKLGAFARTEKTTAAIRRDLEGVFDVFPQLRERCHQLAGTLSGGEQQMCAIGRALMSKPKLLMIDELSLGLAPIVVEMLLGILTRIHAEGTTVLLVEQDAGVALNFADRAIVLETGRIAHMGQAQDLLRDDHVLKSYLGQEM